MFCFGKQLWSGPKVVTTKFDNLAPRCPGLPLAHSPVTLCLAHRTSRREQGREPCGPWGRKGWERADSMESSVWLRAGKLGFSFCVRDRKGPLPHPFEGPWPFC